MLPRPYTVVDLHSHTWGSDGRSSPTDIARAAKTAGLHFLALTDHHTNMKDETGAAADALLSVGITPIVGCEYSTEQGHLLIFGLPVEHHRWGMYPNIQTVIDDANAAGAICIVPHAYKGYKRSLKENLEKVTGLAAVEALNGQVEDSTPALNRLAEQSAIRMGVPMVASSDAHTATDLGLAYTRFDGHLSTVGEVLNALRSGRGFTPFRSRRLKERALEAEKRQKEADARRKEWAQEDREFFAANGIDPADIDGDGYQMGFFDPAYTRDSGKRVPQFPELDDEPKKSVLGSLKDEFKDRVRNWNKSQKWKG
jgi:predicted metal-dependent phosphoesterase TrpH